MRPGLVGLGEQSVGGLLELHALAWLGADVQQAHPGVLDAQKPPGVVSAHKGELEQVLRGALGGGPAVNEDHVPPGIGHHRGQGRPADAPDAFDEQGGRRQQGSGGTGGDESLPRPSLSRRRPTVMEASGLSLKARAGLSSISMTWLAGAISTPGGGAVWPSLARQAPISARPAGEQNLHAQLPDPPRRAPSTGAWGALSPPMAPR